MAWSKPWEASAWDAIEAKLRNLLAALAPLPEDFSPQTDLLESLALDSAQLMEFVMEVEDHFELVIEQEKLAEVRNIAQLADIVRRMTS